MRERILAVVGAIGLIAGAFFLRSVIAGDDSTDDGPDGSNGRQNAGAPVVACERDLQAVCDALVEAGTITAAPSLTLSGAAADDLTVDGWITWDPAPGIANFDRPDTWGATEALASAPLGVLTFDGTSECGPTSTWLACVVAGAEQGVPVGVGSGTTAQSLARLHPIAGSLVPDEGDYTQVNASTLRRVIDSPQGGQSDYVDQIRTFITTSGALSIVVGPVPALEVAPTSPRLAGRNAAVHTLTPAAEITVVIATRQSSSDTPPVAADALLGDPAVEAVFTELGLTPGTGTVSDQRQAGEVYAIRDKVT